jgi:DNA-binding transcriptional LysR family regulator
MQPQSPTPREVNLARLDLVSLHLVVCCASAGSISAAAAQCHLSVMAASERLRRLEHTFGKPLFHRHRHGVTPTEAGAVLVEFSTRMIDLARNAAAQVSCTQASIVAHGANTGRRRSKPDVNGAGQEEYAHQRACVPVEQ